MCPTIINKTILSIESLGKVWKDHKINSDPNVVKESVLCESDDINDSGMETTPSLIDESNLTSSVITSEAKAESTPVISKVKELTLDDIYNFMRTVSDDLSSNCLLYTSYCTAKMFETACLF